MRHTQISTLDSCSGSGRAGQGIMGNRCILGTQDPYILESVKATQLVSCSQPWDSVSSSWFLSGSHVGSPSEVKVQFSVALSKSLVSSIHRDNSPKIRVVVRMT